MARKAEKKHQGAKLALKPPIDQVPVLPGPPPPGSAIEPAMPPPVPKKRQKNKKTWTQSAVPKQQSQRDKVAAICALKIQGYTTAEIAEYLGIKPHSVQQYMWLAGKNGWLDNRDPNEVMQSELIHKVVDNFKEWLHAKDARTGLPDKETMLEGVKLFFGNKNGSAVQSDAQMTNVLAIQITMPQAGAQLPQMRPNTGGGRPAYQDGDVIDVITESRRQLSE